MGLLDFFRQKPIAAEPERRVSAEGSLAAPQFLDDPEFLEFLRVGVKGGASNEALKNTACMRAISVISNSIGRLPLNLISTSPDKTLAGNHPAYRLVKRRPNKWQTPFEFKSMMQTHALLSGNGYARVIRSAGRPICMIPMKLGTCVPKQSDDWNVHYDWTTPSGNTVRLESSEVFHLRGLTTDGLIGLAPVKLGAEAIKLAQDAERAASRVFNTGNMAGGALEFPNNLSETAYDRIKTSMEENYTGAENVGKFMVIEGGGKVVKFSSTAADAQQIENRNHQIEEVARLYGVPRPLLMMDDTSWGSGISQLGIFLVQYTLAPWFTAWEQALVRVLLTEEEMEQYQFQFNEAALLRGSMTEQANFLSKALGAGGQAPWMTPNEVREVVDLPRSNDSSADELRNPMTQKGKQ